MAPLLERITHSPRFKSFMIEVAWIGAVLTLIAFVPKLRGGQTMESVLIVGMASLSIVALFLGWLFPCPDERGSRLWKFAMLLTGFSLAVVIVGLLFRLMHWAGGFTMLIAGIVGLAISAVAWLLYFINRRNYYEN